VGALLGLDKYTSRKRLLETKKPDWVEKKKGDVLESYMHWGTCMECTALAAVDEFFFKTDGREPCCRIENIVHGQNHRVCGTPDGITKEIGMFIPIEVKCPAHPSPELCKPYETVDDIPLKYFAQIQTYIELLNAPHGYLVCWTMFNGMSIFVVHRNLCMFPRLVLPLIDSWVVGDLSPRVTKGEKNYHARMLAPNTFVEKIL